MRTFKKHLQRRAITFWTFYQIILLYKHFFNTSFLNKSIDSLVVKFSCKKKNCKRNEFLKKESKGELFFIYICFAVMYIFSQGKVFAHTWKFLQKYIGFNKLQSVDNVCGCCTEILQEIDRFFNDRVASVGK